MYMASLIMNGESGWMSSEQNLEHLTSAPDRGRDHGG